MRTSLKGRKFIARFEGMSLKPYNDPSGYATVGVGHLIALRPVNLHDKLTWNLPHERAALELLADDLKGRDAALTERTRRGTTQRQFDALSSLQFNIGEGALASSTVLRLHNQRKFYRAGLAFLMWNKSGGRVLLGLSRRRRAERRLYRKGLYT